MTDRDFQIDGKEFKLSKIDAFKQFHIVRKLGPILGDIIPVAQKLKSLSPKADSTSSDQMVQEIGVLVKPIMDGLSKLTEEDANKVLLGLLASVEIKQSQGNWARIAREDSLMIENLDLKVMLQAAGRAFMYNLSGFFAIAPQVSHGGK